VRSREDNGDPRPVHAPRQHDRGVHAVRISGTRAPAASAFLEFGARTGLIHSKTVQLVLSRHMKASGISVAI
jgi:hypothetical protein